MLTIPARWFEAKTGMWVTRRCVIRDIGLKRCEFTTVDQFVRHDRMNWSSSFPCG